MSAAVSRDDQPSYPVRSVAKALEILLLLGERESIGVSEVSRRLQVARSTSHRLLAMLEHYGFAQRHPRTRGYRLGPALVSLGLTAVLNLDIRRRARPHMERLAAEVEETVTLMALEETNVRFLDCVESPLPIRVGARVGLVRPAHCTSAGKAILAELSAEEFDKLYPEDRLVGLTEHSIRDRDGLRHALEEIRMKGYATNLGESDPDLAAVGVAIPDVFGAPRVGLGISAPASRLSPERVETIGEAARGSARAIARAFE